jgi:predicted phage terminase large subunit-like protein
MGGDRFATSVGGSVTGMHGHFLIVDDPVDPRGAASELELKDACDWLDVTLSTRKVDKEVTPLILIMQRLDPGDPTQHLIDKVEEGKRIRHLCLPCDILPKGETGETWTVKPEKLKRFYERNGGFLDRRRLGYGILQEAVVDLGARVFAGQYGQAPRPIEGNMFLRKGFTNIMEEPPDKFVQRVRYWDKAGTEDRKGEQIPATAGVRMGQLRNGRFVVEDCITIRKRASEREEIIKATAVQDGVDVTVVLEQEPGSGGKESAESSVRNLAGFKVVVDNPQSRGSKIARAEPWSTQVNNGNCILIRGNWNTGYIARHCDFPAGFLKDEVDASSGAFSYLTGLSKKRKRGGVW